MMASMIDRVRGFIARLAPQPVCEACIVERLELKDTGAASLAIHALAGADGFERTAAECTLCGTAGTLIHKAR